MVAQSSSFSGVPVPLPGLSSEQTSTLAQLGLLTGPDGSNSAFLGRTYRFLGGDTQLLGNFEYRIPIFGPVTLAAFADIGSVFNLRNTGTQRIDSEFLRDDLLIGAGTLTGLALRNAPTLANAFGAIPLVNGIPLRADQYLEFCQQVPGCNVDTRPAGFETAYLRGDVQTNQLVKVNESVFNKLGDFRSSIGMELRVQVPIVNVPFRLIYFYNPNGKFGITKELPTLRLPGRTKRFPIYGRQNILITNRRLSEFSKLKLTICGQIS